MFARDGLHITGKGLPFLTGTVRGGCQCLG